MTIDQVRELAWWVIVWVVASPAVSALAVYAWMRWKWRAGIEHQILMGRLYDK